MAASELEIERRVQIRPHRQLASGGVGCLAAHLVGRERHTRLAVSDPSLPEQCAAAPLLATAAALVSFLTPTLAAPYRRLAMELPNVRDRQLFLPGTGGLGKHSAPTLGDTHQLSLFTCVPRNSEPLRIPHTPPTSAIYPLLSIPLAFSLGRSRGRASICIPQPGRSMGKLHLSLASSHPSPSTRNNDFVLYLSRRLSATPQF